MITEPVRVISARRLEALRASQRRLRWSFGLGVCLALAFGVCAAGPPHGRGQLSRGLALTEAVSLAEAADARDTVWDAALLSAVDDPLYDRFLQQYEPLRTKGERRRYVTAQVLAAAAVHRLDADLLFALIAAESGFDSEAVSPKGARGLGQMVFATARAVAPDAVRSPEDLHDVPRNLYATALHLRQLLDATEGDLRWALRTYYAGTGDRNVTGPDRDQYVARVSTHYAHLKAKRSYDHLTGPAPGGAD